MSGRQGPNSVDNVGDDEDSPLTDVMDSIKFYCSKRYGKSSISSSSHMTHVHDIHLFDCSFVNVGQDANFHYGEVINSGVTTGMGPALFCVVGST